jgi:hypothetical protein
LVRAFLAKWRRRAQYFQFAAAAGNGGLELEICIGEHAGGGGGAVERIGQHSQQLFHLSGAHVRLAAEQVIEIVGVDGQLLILLHPFAKPGVPHADQFRSEEGQRGRDLPKHAGGPALHAGGFLIGGIHGLSE